MDKAQSVLAVCFYLALESFSGRPCQESHTPTVPNPFLSFSLVSAVHHLVFSWWVPKGEVSGALKEGDPAVHPTNSHPKKYSCGYISAFAIQTTFEKP